MILRLRSGSSKPRGLHRPRFSIARDTIKCMNTTRLARHFLPSHYTLELSLERQERTFGGTVQIAGQTLQPGRQIRLHAHKLTITVASIDGQPVGHTQEDGELVLTAAQDLAIGEHNLTISFNGVITNPMHGLYPCYFTLDGAKEEILATQFESHHAREVFPCIDEPEAKATFDLTLTTESGITVLGNTPVVEQRQADGRLVTRFGTTPVMSTYLLAWVAGKLDYQEATTKDGVLVRAYATPDKKDQVGFALESAVKSLEFFNDYFGISYPLAKCDLIALPDFSSGAMENWGCITFRETALLVSEHTATKTKQYVAMVVAHELAHQWFGNLVTMKWWNDLWLNESFANWIEYLATDHMFPEWDMWTQYYDEETTYAVQRDSLATVQKIQQEVNTPDEIQTLFDPAIVYAKGGSLLNMLHAYLGADAFRDGLRLYLKRHQYANTEAHDLWQALGEVSGRDVVGFMQPWITQAGLPVVSVSDGGPTVALRQQRFYGNPQRASHDEPVLWPIPLLADGQLGEDLLTAAETSTTLQRTDRALLLNQGRTGYYLSAYDEEHMEQLAADIAANRVPVIDRLGLLSDSLSLGKAGMQPYLYSLHFLDAYRHEASHSVWGAINDHLGALKMFADDDEELLAALRTYIRNLAREQYDRLGWDAIADEPHVDRLLRPMVIAHMAYAEDEAVVAKLRDLFAAADKPSDIWGDIRSTVLAVSAKFDGKQAFDKIIDWYHGTTSAEERVQLAAGLSGVRDPELIQQALGLLTTGVVKMQDLFYWVVYLSKSRYARDATWEWVQQNWQWIVDQFGNDMHYTDFPKYTAASFSKPEQLAEYKAFFEPKLNVASLHRSIQQGIEDIEGRVLWCERDGEAVARYLLSLSSS